MSTNASTTPTNTATSNTTPWRTLQTKDGVIEHAIAIRVPGSSIDVAYCGIPFLVRSPRLDPPKDDDTTRCATCISKLTSRAAAAKTASAAAAKRAASTRS